MKYIILATILLCSTSQAKEFKFTFVFEQGRTENKLQYKTDADSWEQAYKRGSSFCFDFFAERETDLTEEKGIDIIDACANPR